MRRRKKLFIVIMSLLTIIGLFLFEMNSYSKTYGSFWITDKKIVNDKYFISVGYHEPWIQLECTKQVYTNVILDDRVRYKMFFKTKVHYPYVGKLINIDMENIYDVRD
ncbi:MAG: hypothetical protein K0S47_2145 [Herbinix sp.]|jgi:hypothetical protein|nr:hypothetical protein [Herbinix sp.]